ncbi:unnamed protein product [Ectocarpus sp. 4 AP-2014]
MSNFPLITCVALHLQSMSCVQCAHSSSVIPLQGSRPLTYRSPAAVSTLHLYSDGGAIRFISLGICAWGWYQTTGTFVYFADGGGRDHEPLHNIHSRATFTIRATDQ